MNNDVEAIPVSQPPAKKPRKTCKVVVTKKDLGITFPNKFSLGPFDYNQALIDINQWKRRIKEDYGRISLMEYVTGARPKESVYVDMKSFKPANHSGEFVAKRIETIAEIDEKLCRAINSLCEYDHRIEEPVSHSILEVDGRTKDAAVVVRRIVDEALELWNDLVKEEWKDYKKMRDTYAIAKCFHSQKTAYVMARTIQRNKGLVEEILQCHSDHGAEEVQQKHGEFAKVFALRFKRKRAYFDK